MQRTIVIICTVAWLLFARCAIRTTADTPLAVGSPSSLVSRLDSVVQNLVTTKKTASLAIGYQRAAESPYVAAYGLADVENGRAATAQTAFRIASITKPLTATAVLQLVERGQLDLNDRLTRFFPSFPNGEKVTVYQLLSHTSGIPNWWDGELPPGTPATFPMCDSPHRYLQAMKKTFLFPPGTAYAYSNSEYVLLGEIIERCTGLSFERFLKQTIFDPAAMRETTLENPVDSARDWATGYRVNDNAPGSFVRPTPVYPLPFAAGALRSTAGDLLAFSRALMTGRLLNKKWLRKMSAQALTLDGTPVYAAPYVPPGSQPPPAPPNVQKMGYGLGLSLMEVYGTPVIWHSGGIQGFNGVWVYVPRTRTTLVLLANTENGLVSALDEVFKILTAN